MPTSPRMDPEQVWIEDLTLTVLSNDQTLQALIEEIDLSLAAPVLGDNTVETNHIVNGTILNEDIADGTIGPEKLVPGTIPAAIAGGAVDPMPIGMILPYGGATPPAGYLFCDGTTKASATYPQLSAVLGDGAASRYGSTGAGNFTLPDLRGRFSLGAGTGSGLTGRVQGVKAGDETIALSISQMPAHTHAFLTWQDANPGQSYFLPNLYGSFANPLLFRSNNTTSQGSGSAHPNMPPFETSLYVIRADVPQPDTPVLSTPADLASGEPLAAVLVWLAAANASAYQIQVDDTDDTFASKVFDVTSSLLTVTVEPDLISQVPPFFWRVRALNAAGASAWTAAWEFTTV